MQASATRPAGRLAISCGETVAEIDRVGATLRALRIGGDEIIDGDVESPYVASGRGQVLAPWPNRLDGGSYSFGGRRGQAPIDEPEHGNAIHGLVRWLRFDVLEMSAESVRLASPLAEQPAYPFPLRLEIEYTAVAGGLEVAVEAASPSGPAPFGYGFHPYLSVGTPDVDEIVLHVPAEHRLLLDERGLPVGEERVAATGYDFCTPRRIGRTVLDDCFSGLLRPEQDGGDGAGRGASGGAGTPRLCQQRGRRSSAAGRVVGGPELCLADVLHGRHDQGSRQAQEVSGAGTDDLPAQCVSQRRRLDHVGARALARSLRIEGEMIYPGIERLKVDRRDDGVVVVTIDRPQVLNAVDVQTHHELAAVWEQIDRDPQARVAVVTGAGEAFCAGGEMSMLEEMVVDHEAVMVQLRDAAAIVRAMIDCEKPIVSAINGVAVGAGLTVALLADISIIGESVRLSDGHARIGVAAGDHAVLIWPLLCGMARAKYHLLTAGFVDGVEAERIGLVSKCVPDAEVMRQALDVAERLAAGSQTAIRFTKHALNNWLRSAMPAFEHSLALEMLSFLGPDAKEGVAALRAKRRPSFPSAGAP